MGDSFRTSLEAAFHERLLAALMEVKKRTRAGVDRTLERVQSVGGLQTAKEKLETRDGDSAFAYLLNRPGKYFWAAKRVGRMDLSIEAIVLEPGWSDLFNPKEIDNAASRLREHGFSPAFEPALPLDVSDPAPPFAELSIRESRGSLAVFELGKAGCDLAEQQAGKLRARQSPTVSKVVRHHLNDCMRCWKLYPDLVAAYERFDQEVLKYLMNLLRNFQASLLLGDADLKRFMERDLEDYETAEDYEADLDVEVGVFILPRCAWRAVRLGCHVGHFMSAFSSTYDEMGNIWLRFRSGEVRGPVSDFIRSMDRDLFFLALVARNLLFVRYWPKEEEDILWVPTDGDLESIPGLVQADEVSDFDDWEEILGKPPEDLNPMGVLYLSERTAIAELQSIERSEIAISPDRARQEQLDRLEARLSVVDEIRAGQDAVVDHLERMVKHMSNNDLYASEQALRVELPGVYERLDFKARRLLLASEQMYRTPDFAVPGQWVQALATAFEVQLRNSLLSTLLGYLKEKGTPSLRPLQECKDADPSKHVYSRGKSKAENFTLGHMRLLFAHTHPHVVECFERLGLNGVQVAEVVAEVEDRRNRAAHGHSIDRGEAEEIRDTWLKRGGRKGGIFAAIFEDAERLR